MSTSGKELLKSFDLLPEIEKREVASEIIRRTFSPERATELEETELEKLYASFADEDRALAEESMEDYERDLTIEDAS
jgi:hypothetical protein